MFPLFNLTIEASHLWFFRSSHINISPGCYHLCDCASGGKGGNNTKARLCGEISSELSLKLKRSAVQNETRGSNPITSSLPSLFKAATPSFSVVFVAFILGSKHPDAWAFLSGNNCGHPCLFSPLFHFMKPQSMCHCVCSEGPDIHFGGLGHCLHWWLE